MFGQGGVPQDHPVRLRRLVRASRLALTCRHETHCGIIAPPIPQPTCPRVSCLRIIPSTSTGSWLTPTCQRGPILASSRHKCHTQPAEERLPGLALGCRDHPVRGELRPVATHAQGGAGCQTPGCREPTRCLCAAHRGQEGSSTALQSCFPCAMGRAVQAVRRSDVPIAYRCPWQNPFAERVVGTLRRELLDHVIVLSQAHLDKLLREFIDAYYHVARPHQGLQGHTPIPHERPAPTSGPTRLISIPVLGGLHHRYLRVAA